MAPYSQPLANGHDFKHVPEVYQTKQPVESKLREVTCVASTFNVLGDRTVNEVTVRQMLDSRRDRAKFLDRKLFSDPAWDILLELLVSYFGQRRMATTDLCNASNVPATTALRWIGTLENQGLIRRHSDPFDGRRSFVSLTAGALTALDDYFSHLSVYYPPVNSSTS